MIGRRKEFRDAMAGIAHGGVELRGASGVGKSVLLDAVTQRCRRSGWTVVEIRTSESTSGIPFWAVFPMLPAGVPTERDRLAAEIRETIESGDDDARVLVAVDDAQNLDDDSVALLRELVGDQRWSIAASVRTDTVAPGDLESLWRASGAVTVDVRPFDADESASFIASVLDGPVSAELAESVVGVAAGNALLTRELLLDAVESGTVHVIDGEWVASDHSEVADTGERTRRCVERRIGRLDDQQARLLQLVAVASGLDERTVPDGLRAPLEQLERFCLLSRHRQSDVVTELRVDHPLIGRVVIDGLSRSQRWARTRDLIEMTRGIAPLRSEAAVQIALWAHDCGFELEAVEWVAAARAALAAFDVDSAERWARAAIAVDDEHHDAHRCLGEVLRLRGDPSAAAVALADAAACAVTVDDVVATALTRAAVLGFQLGQPGEALEILVAAANDTDDPVTSLSLRSEAAVMGTLLGRFEDVLLSQPPSDLLASADERTQWLLGQNEVYARAMLGRVDAVPDLVADLRPHYISVAEERPHELDLLLGSLGAARLQCGNFQVGIEELLFEMRSVPQPGFWGITSSVLSLLMHLVGDPRAVEVADAGVAAHEQMDPFGSMPIAIAAAALADGASDVAALEGHRGRLAGSEPWTSIWIGRAQARAAFLSGDRDDAVRRCVDAGELALDTNHFAYAAVTLHDAVVYGAAVEVAVPLGDAVAESRGAVFLELLSAHATASQREDVDGLDYCARRFVSHGARSLGAFAFSQAALGLHRRGDDVGARRVDTCARVVGGTASTFPARPDLGCVHDRLSDREIQAVALAARGFTSKEMASNLYLSVRTVDNHLSAAYRKLAVDGRGEVGELFSRLVGDTASAD